MTKEQIEQESLILGILSQKEFNKRAKTIKELLLDNGFKPFAWDLASEGDVLFYRIINKRLIIILFSNDTEYVGRTINIHIVSVDAKAPDITMEQFACKILEDDRGCISTNNIGLLQALILYKFDVVIEDSWYF